MADAVTTRVLVNGGFNYVIRMTSISDGTGETNVTKITRSSLVNSFGLVPSKINIKMVTWSIQGFTSVRLLWDHTTPDVAEVLATGPGYRDYSDTSPLVDPGSAGGTGNITLTSVGAVSGATYDIELWCTLPN